jgi:hypothetical protein
MGFLDWWRRRATTDPTDIGATAPAVELVVPPEREPPELELDELRRAAAAHPELQAVYVFRDGRADPGTLAVGVLLDEAVSEERLETVVADLGARIRAEDWGAQRVAVEPLGAELLNEADAIVGPLYER